MLQKPLSRVVVFAALVIGGAAAAGVAVWANRERLAAETTAQQETTKRAQAEQQLASLKHELAQMREEHAADEGRLEQGAKREQQAHQSAEELRRALEFLEQKVLSAGTPAEWTGPPRSKITLREALDAAEPEIAHQCADQPLVEAFVRSTFGRAYLDLREPAKAVEQLRKALALREKALGPHDPATVACRNDLARAYRLADRPSEAASLFDQ